MQEQRNYSHKIWHICIEIASNGSTRIGFKDTNSEKAPSNETPALTKSMNMNNWVVGTSNQLFVIGSYTEIKFSKKIKQLLVKLCSLW